MVELYPAPFPNLLRRIFTEYERETKIFDLPANKFYCDDGALDLSVQLHGKQAATPVGPAAGPQSQLAQNIVLSWLAGARIIELKTVQINDELKIPRPCIDATNVGYNVEWSQELKLPISLREYVAGSMLIDILRQAGLPDRAVSTAAGNTIFDMSVGYDLAGIQSPQVCDWIAQMRDARQLVAQLRDEIPTEFKALRDIEFTTQISDSITLSTFHGCPANEIERIVEFLLGELDVHTIIKMNPTLLGREAVEQLLHDTLGYREVGVTQEAFDKDLQFDQAVEICHRLQHLAARRGKRLGVKFSNTLVVLNHRSFFSDEMMYLSGAPLHVITLNLVKKFREVMGPDLPISFSAGIDQHNFVDAVAQGFVPVTTCTDLLRPGGYGRLPAYLTRLKQKMQTLGVSNISDFVIVAEGQGTTALEAELTQWPIKLGEVWRHLNEQQRTQLNGWCEQLRREATEQLQGEKIALAPLFEHHASHYASLLRQLPEALQGRLQEALKDLYPAVVRRAGWLNTNKIVPRTTADTRYQQAKNSSVPRKIASKLWLYDCINCDKCIPVCPNDANFAYQLAAIEVQCLRYRVQDGKAIAEPGRQLKIEKTHQIGNFADFCNECGNCDVFCPEEGGPYIEKPRFFGTLARFRNHSDHDGCYFERTAGEDLVYGRFHGQEYLLTIVRREQLARFTDGQVTLEFDCTSGQCQRVETLSIAESEHVLDDYYYYVLKALWEGVLENGKINYLNIQYLTSDRLPPRN
ncbi:MAG: glutamate synthase [Acidobacteriota bacterium]